MAEKDVSFVKPGSKSEWGNPGKDLKFAGKGAHIIRGGKAEGVSLLGKK